MPLHRGELSSMESGSTRRVSVGQVTFSRPGQYQVVVTGLSEKRAFYLDEAKFIRMFLSVMVSGLLWYAVRVGKHWFRRLRLCSVIETCELIPH